jgi:DNA-binding NtrC family response regulator
MQNEKPKVLIVEDDESIQDSYKEFFEDSIQIFAALPIAQARELFSQHPDIAAIVMDACVPGISPTTPPLVKQLRAHFTGPMIATSSNPDYNRQLMAAGCEEAYEKSAERVRDTVLRLLTNKNTEVEPAANRPKIGSWYDAPLGKSAPSSF